MDAALVPFGIIGRTHGLKGAVSGKFLPDTELAESFDIEEPVYLELNGDPVPFFLEWIQEEDDRFRLKFDHIHSIEEAQELISAKLYASEDFIQSTEIEFDFIDFEIYDQNRKPAGVIIDFEEHGLSFLVRTKDAQSNEHLIPFDESLIITIDENKKEIQMQIAEGLLDL